MGTPRAQSVGARYQAMALPSRKNRRWVRRCERCCPDDPFGTALDAARRAFAAHARLDPTGADRIDASLSTSKLSRGAGRV